MFERLRTFVSALSAGDEGERIARRFLGAKPGWTFVAANWRNPRDRREELDGVVGPEQSLVAIGEDAQLGGDVAEQLQHLGAVDEVAPTVVFLASKRSTYTSGTIVTIDGGWSSRPAG